MDYNKLVLTDVDGVLLDWELGFDDWMQFQGYQKVDNWNEIYKIGERYGISNNRGHDLVRIFNNHARVGYLPALRDAVEYVKKLHHEHGYKFRCITSLSLDPYAKKIRTNNLFDIFGEQVFDGIICLDTGADKDDALEPYRDTGLVWIEDKPENAVVGNKLGLKAILVEHGHNVDFELTDNVKRVQNWKEIYELLV